MGRLRLRAKPFFFFQELGESFRLPGDGFPNSLRFVQNFQKTGFSHFAQPARSRARSGTWRSQKSLSRRFRGWKRPRQCCRSLERARALQFQHSKFRCLRVNLSKKVHMSSLQIYSSLSLCMFLSPSLSLVLSLRAVIMVTPGKGVFSGGAPFPPSSCMK